MTHNEKDRIGDEYEYVDLSDYIRGKLSSSSEWLSGFAIPLICIGICVICIILLKTGRSSAIIFMLIALILLALFFAFALRQAWRDKKSAALKAQRAQNIYDFAQRKKAQDPGEGEQEDDGQGTQGEGNE